jgi:hypothetical protein
MMFPLKSGAMNGSTAERLHQLTWQLDALLRDNEAMRKRVIRAAANTHWPEMSRGPHVVVTPQPPLMPPSNGTG